MHALDAPTALQPASEELQELRRKVFTGDLNLVLNRSIEHLFEVSRVEPGEGRWELPQLPQAADFTYEYGGKRHQALDVVANTFADGLILLKDGAIALESYANMARPETRFLSFSMGKCLNALLVGLAIDDGSIGSVHDPIERYIPELAGTDWEGIELHHMLQFRTGIDWNDYPYTPGPAWDAHEDCFVRTIAHYHAPAAGLKRTHAPGTVFNYSSLETSLIAVAVERAVGRRLNDYFSERLWQPAGMESQAYWVLDGDPEHGGREITGGTYNAVLRDYARIGLIFANEGMAGGKRILPAEWIRRCAVPGGGEVLEMNPGFNFGYQVWTVDGSPAYAAIGSGGQFIFVDPATATVGVKMSHAPQAYPHFKPSAEEALAFFQAASAWNPR